MEIRIQLLSFKSEQPSFDADPSSPQPLNSNARRKRMWIVSRNHDTRNARLDQTIRTRGRVIAPLRARFQRHINSRAARVGLRQRLLLRMRPPAICSTRFRNHRAVAHDHAANRRIVASLSHTGRRER